jgi:DNA-binding SARP family transcriptional activator
MPRPSVRLLGPPRIEHGGRTAHVDTKKAIALLGYLAVARRPTARDELAALLWPESDQVRARSALRRTLSTLNAALGEGGLVIDGDTISLKAPTDVAEFRRLVASDRLDDAARVYAGDFLSGFSLRDSAEFDDWQLATTASLKREYTGVLARLARESEVDEAIAYARRWVDADPLDEDAHRALIRLHTQKGDRTAAVRQYQECVALLERHLGVTPSDETARLVERAPRDDANLHELMGDLLTLQGRYGEAERSYALAESPAAKIAAVRQRVGDYEGAEKLYADALEALRPAEYGSRARLLADRSLNAHRLKRAAEAQQFAAMALDDAVASRDDRAIAQAHNVAGILAAHDDNAEARAHLEASLKLAERLDDPVAMAAALNNLASALRTSDLDRAQQLAQRALELCASVGDRHREAAMHSNLADLLRAAGRTTEAERHLRLSAAIFAVIGEPDELQPEIWMLTEW